MGITTKRPPPAYGYARLSMVTFGTVFVTWCTLSYAELVPAYFLPSPTAVARELYMLFVNDGFAWDVMHSLLRVLSGFVVSSVAAVPLGIVMGTFAPFDALFSTFFGFIRFIPATAFIPLLILWLGIGEIEKVAILFIATFFYLVLFISDIARNVKREFVETALTLGATKMQILLRVIVPTSMPAIWNALRVMTGVGWTTLVVVEIVAAQSGIAAMMIQSQRFLKTGRIMAGIITIGVLGLISDCFFKKMYSILYNWAEE